MNYLKKALYTIFIISIFVSCEDFLNERPPDQLTANEFYKSEKGLRAATNDFYHIVPNADEIWGEYVDDAAQFNVPHRIKGTRTVPATGGGWTWNALRDINFFLAHVEQFQGLEKTKNKYKGVARFFRAWFYFKKIKRFGDVPWYSQVISTDDKKLLQQPRDSRKNVLDSILVDINYAIENLSQEKDVAKITKWTALALKSRIFLYEGTYRKYHDMSGYKEMLNESMSASLQLIQDSEYGIYSSNPDIAYKELFVSNNAKEKEIILARKYDQSIPLTHQVNFYTNSSSFGRPGVTKQVINSYLMKDGSRFTEKSNFNKLGFYQETRDRDPRLAQTVRTPGYKRKGSDTPVDPDFSASLSGYQYIKYIQSPSHYVSNDNDLPIFRYAEVLLNYAEAKAEKGTLSQNDLDISIKLIRDRINMPNINMLQANGNPDPFLATQYEHVKGANKGVILEIRRERRIELIREGFRWDDLMRWMEGDNVARTFKGMYFPSTGEYDLDKNGSIDLVIYEGGEPSNKIAGAQYKSIESMHLENGKDGGLMVINGDISKKFDQTKDYLYPIPLQELTLNPNLNQNPGWPSQ